MTQFSATPNTIAGTMIGREGFRANVPNDDRQ